MIGKYDNALICGLLGLVLSHVASPGMRVFFGAFGSVMMLCWLSVNVAEFLRRRP